MGVFLLEDEPLFYRYISEALHQEGIEVFGTSSGEEAYKEVSKNLYELYLLDVFVEGEITGIEVLQKIKEDAPDKPVIIMSSDSRMQTIREAYGSLCDDYMKKPFDAEELVLKVRRHLKRGGEKVVLAEGFVYDMDRGELLREEEPVPLTRMERRMIRLLVENRDRIVEYARIMELLWGTTDIAQNQGTLRTMLKRLRGKTADRLVETVSGVGLRIGTRKE